MGNMTANQRLASHIKACEQQMSCVYARTAAEAKQIQRRAEAGSLEAVMPGLYARPEYWSELKFRQRYLHRVRALAPKAPRLDILLLYGGCYLWPFGFACQFDAHPYRRDAGPIDDAGLLRSFVIAMLVKHVPPRWDIAVTDIDQTITVAWSMHRLSRD